MTAYELEIDRRNRDLMEDAKLDLEYAREHPEAYTKGYIRQVYDQIRQYREELDKVRSNKWRLTHGFETSARGENYSDHHWNRLTGRNRRLRAVDRERPPGNNNTRLYDE